MSSGDSSSLFLAVFFGDFSSSVLFDSSLSVLFGVFLPYDDCSTISHQCCSASLQMLFDGSSSVLHIGFLVLKCLCFPDFSWVCFRYSSYVLFVYSPSLTFIVFHRCTLPLCSRGHGVNMNANWIVSIWVPQHQHYVTHWQTRSWMTVDISDHFQIQVADATRTASLSDPLLRRSIAALTALDDRACWQHSSWSERLSNALFVYPAE